MEECGVVLEIPVTASKGSPFDITNFSKVNDIVLAGTYVGDNGKEIKINKTIKTRNEWIGNAVATLDQQIAKFVPFSVGEKSGTIVQTIIKSGLENNSLPIEQMLVTINVPQVNGKNPTSVNIATNGKITGEFTKDNWNYDNQTGIITINIKNEPQENYVVWEKDVKDEFIVTYEFEDKVEEIATTQTANVEIKAYNSVATKVEANNELKIESNEKIGELVTSNIVATEALSKGYLYTKAQKEVSYSEVVTADIANYELIDGITITQDIDYFVDGEGRVALTTIENQNYAYYKTTKISKANFEKILGTDGTITISSLDGKQIATINKEVAPDENGDYVIEYEEETNEIQIKTSKLIAIGKLEIRHEKALKGNTAYSKKQVERFQTLRVSAKVQAIANSIAVSDVEAIKEIGLVAPSTQVESTISNPDLSTVVTNQNVELRVILKTNDISCDLYKNPKIEIILPNYIKKLDLKNINLLFDNELKIKDYNSYVNKNGNIVIVVNIEGEQTLYSQDEISKGANLIINADITLKQLTPTRNDVMQVYVTNENATTYGNIATYSTRSATTPKAYVETPLNAVAPVGIVTINQISGYNANNETATSISGQEQIGKLDVKKQAKTATVQMNIINNYEHAINNVSILGRIPTAGSKNVDTNEDYVSNLETSITSAITASGIDASKVEIYYSENQDATKDLNIEANGWTKTTSNLANMKSYLIVINGEIATGTTLSFAYGLAIPENLSYNMQAYSNYVVYFNNAMQRQQISEKAVSPKVGLTTGEGPELEVSIESDITSENKIEEGKVITYTITVKNVGKTEVKNVTVSGNIPEKTVYTYFTGSDNLEEMGSQGGGIMQMYDESVKNYTQVIQSIGAGETKTIQYKVETRTLNLNQEELEQGTIEATAQATVESYDTVFASEKVTNTLVEGYLKLSIDLTGIPAQYPRSEGDEVKYEINVENVNMKNKENVKVYCNIPEGLTFKQARQNGTLDQATNKVVWDIGTLVGLDQKTLIATFTVNNLADNIYEKDITNTATVKTADKELTSNEVTFKVKKANLTVSQTSETAQEVAVGDTIYYNIVVENNGAGTARNVKITDYIPEGLRYDGVQYSVEGTTTEENIGAGNGVITLSGLNAGAVVDIKLKAVAKDLDVGTTSRKVTNIVKVTADGMNEISSNEITHTIVPKNSTIVDDPSIDKPIEGTYKISGIAWLDSNKDGKRENTEQLLGNIKVMLINADNGQIVKDIVTGKTKEQQTNSYGAYTFANLKPGNYIVIFLYDSGSYGLTIYKAQGVNDNKNSDVVAMNINLEGNIRQAAVSDALVLANKNIENIDMGLVINPQFDLKLDKVITKIIVNDSKGTKINEYKDEKLAKLDLNSKTANGSTIMIEYKITVKNEGAVAGYAKKIVDYIPQGMNFISELNEDWYSSDNGNNLYNNSLANTIINPGETKEVTLMLTKKITNNNMGIINNTAEIAESYNDLGLKDLDSIPGNKVQGEDDMSSADAIVGTKTGEIYIYITLTISTIAILGVGVFLIRKKVLKRV